ncbi:Hypothetical protein ABZS17G119_02620 [Kosakonia cowanii]
MNGLLYSFQLTKLIIFCWRNGAEAGAKKTLKEALVNCALILS